MQTLVDLLPGKWAKRLLIRSRKTSTQKYTHLKMVISIYIFFSSQCLEGLLNICILGFDIRMLLLMLLLDSFFFVFGFSDSVFREKDISIQIFGSEFFAV